MAKKNTSIFIGRKEEQNILKEALQSTESEMIAVIGRRRVGKTFLIKTVYAKELAFELIGIQDGDSKIQLERFRDQLMTSTRSTVPLPVPKDWFEAFNWLKAHLQTLPTSKKHVVFFDELPWLATHKSNFLQAFSYFWNSWAWQQNLVVVICGSAASWMIQKVVNDTGGLYNRITRRIFLTPFSLGETEVYLQARGIKFNRYQIAQLYMAMGGIPHYLKEIKAGLSAIQNINNICFLSSGLLHDEFLRLYPSLFPNADRHYAVIRALAQKQSGLTRQELNKQTNISDGGGLSTVLDELTYSGFITPYPTFGRSTKDKIYRLTDEYSLFYLKFIETHSQEAPDTWQHLSQTQIYKTWTGYAFENLCLKHQAMIKKALGIAGIYAQSSTFYKKGDTEGPGIQIDLLIDRNDRVINLFEIKFHNKIYTLSQEHAQELRQKMWRFEGLTQTNKQLFWVFISSYGVTTNEHSLDVLSQSLTLDDLF
jgi:uncharacterized protein